MSTTEAGRPTPSKPGTPDPRDGVSLQAVIEAAISSARRLDELSCARILGTIADAVHAAHKAGQPLAALTPSAITVRPDGSVAFTAAPASPRYTAPERLRGESADRRTDVFTLGVILWEALAHERLFDGPDDAAITRAVLDGAFRPPSELNANVPAELDAICKRALARDPAERYQSAKVIAVEIDAVLGDAGYPESNEPIARFLAALAAPPPSTRSATPAAGLPASAAATPSRTQVPAVTQPRPALAAPGGTQVAAVPPAVAAAPRAASSPPVAAPARAGTQPPGATTTARLSSIAPGTPAPGVPTSGPMAPSTVPPSSPAPAVSAMSTSSRPAKGAPGDTLPPPFVPRQATQTAVLGAAILPPAGAASPPSSPPSSPGAQATPFASPAPSAPPATEPPATVDPARRSVKSAETQILGSLSTTLDRSALAVSVFLGSSASAAATSTAAPAPATSAAPPPSLPRAPEASPAVSLAIAPTPPASTPTSSPIEAPATRSAPGPSAMPPPSTSTLRSFGAPTAPAPAEAVSYAPPEMPAPRASSAAPASDAGQAPPPSAGPSLHPRPPSPRVLSDAGPQPSQPGGPASQAVPQIGLPPGITVPPATPPAPLQSADAGVALAGEPGPAEAVALPRARRVSTDGRDVLAGWAWSTDSIQAIPDDDDFADTARASRRRLVIAIGGALAVVVAVQIVAFAFGDSRPSESSAQASAAAPSSRPATSASSVPAARPTGQPPEAAAAASPPPSPGAPSEPPAAAPSTLPPPAVAAEPTAPVPPTAPPSAPLVTEPPPTAPAAPSTSPPPAPPAAEPPKPQPPAAAPPAPALVAAPLQPAAALPEAVTTRKPEVKKPEPRKLGLKKPELKKPPRVHRSTTADRPAGPPTKAQPVDPYASSATSPEPRPDPAVAYPDRPAAVRAR